MFTRRSLAPIAIFALAKLLLVAGIGYLLARAGAIPRLSLPIVAAVLNIGAGYYGRSVGASGWWCGAMVSLISSVVGAGIQMMLMSGLRNALVVPPALLVAGLLFGLVLVPFVAGGVEGYVGGVIAEQLSPAAPVPGA